MLVRRAKSYLAVLPVRMLNISVSYQPLLSAHGSWRYCHLPIATNKSLTFLEETEMEIILLEKVVNLGALGDKVRVKSGYGRNYLMPFGKAVPATKANIADFEARRAELEKLAAEKKAEAEVRGARLA